MQPWLLRIFKLVFCGKKIVQLRIINHHTSLRNNLRHFCKLPKDKSTKPSKILLVSLSADCILHHHSVRTQLLSSPHWNYFDQCHNSNLSLDRQSVSSPSLNLLSSGLHSKQLITLLQQVPLLVSVMSCFALPWFPSPNESSSVLLGWAQALIQYCWYLFYFS